jgi:hypothetical protein
MNAFYAFHELQTAKYTRDKDGYYGEGDPDLQSQELWMQVAKMLLKPVEI